MTLEELRTSDAVTITPAVAAKILQCDPQFLRVAARTRPDLLGFPVVVIGSRVKIPRAPLIDFLTGGRAGENGGE